MLTGMSRANPPSTYTCMWCAALSATATCAGPIVNDADTSDCPYRPAPRFRPYTAAFTVTLVPGTQYASGRQCISCPSNQCQRPTTGGLVVTVTAFSAAARSGTVSSKCTTMGWPMPYVVRSLSRWLALARRYGCVRLCGLIVVNVVDCSLCCPPAVAATATV